MTVDEKDKKTKAKNPRIDSVTSGVIHTTGQKQKQKKQNKTKAKQKELLYLRAQPLLLILEANELANVPYVNGHKAKNKKNQARRKPKRR